MMYWFDGHVGMMGGWGWLLMVLFWVLAIFGALVLCRRAAPGDAEEARRVPLAVLKERYARGEIGKEEYEQKKRDIES